MAGRVREFGEISAIMKELVRDIDQGLSTMVKKGTVAAVKAAALATPVDTGKARSNYIVTIDFGGSIVRGPFRPGVKLGSGERANLNKVVKAAERSIRPFNAARNKTVFITNAVPYIKFLNDGSPTTRPSNMAIKGRMAAAKAITNLFILPKNQ